MIAEDPPALPEDLCEDRLRSMIKVTISDMENTKDVFSVAELREVLSVRYENNANSFEIEPLEKKARI
jgi:hypothetical protein